jgi:polar amino acid transport system substrate-binding protein
VKNVVTVLIVLPLLFSLHAQTVSLSTHNLEPYGYYLEDGTFTGYAVEVVRHCLDSMGYELILHVVPWKRAQQLAHAGEVDGFFAGSLNPQRSEYFIVSREIAPQNWVWYLPAQSRLDPADPTFRREAVVASFLGANMLEFLLSNGYNIGGTPYDTQVLAEILKANRVDAVLANELVMEEILHKRGWQDDFRRVLQDKKPLYAFFTREFISQNPGFIENFNRNASEYFSRQRD